MSYVLPASSFSTYLSPCFTTVPEKVWLPLVSVEEPAAGLAGDLEPDSGEVVSGVLEDGGVDGLAEDGGVDGLCEGDCVEGVLDGLFASGDCELDGLEVDGVDEDGLALDGLCVSGVLEGDCVLGVCCEAGGISGDGVGCVCGVCCVWSGAVDGVDCAWSALPQEIIPIAIARVASTDRV